MEYKNVESVENWKSDRYSFESTNISFLKPKNIPKKTLEIKLDEIFMKMFSPNGIIFEDGKLTISKHLEELFCILYERDKFNSNVVGIIRNSNILEFIHFYFDFVIINHEKFDDYGTELMVACKVLALFLENHIFLPIEIASTYLIKTLTHLAKSERDVEQAAGACTLSFMIQPSCELPEYVMRKFLPLVLSFRTSFTNNVARLECLHFIHELFRYINDIPPEVIIQINEEIIDIFNEKKISLQKEYTKLYPSCIDCLQMELLNYPQTFQLLIEQNLLQTIHHFLCSNKHKIIVSANHFFSAVFTDKKFIDFVGPNTNYSVIIDNAGYEVDLGVQKSSLWLLIDIASCGPVFIQCLLDFNILEHLKNIYPSQETAIKKLIFRLITNFLLNSSNDQETIIFTSSIFTSSYRDIQIFEEPEIYKFLVAIFNGLQKMSSLDNYLQIKQVLLESDFIQSLFDLESCEQELIIKLSRVIIDIVQSTESYEENE